MDRKHTNAAGAIRGDRQKCQFGRNDTAENKRPCFETQATAPIRILIAPTAGAKWRATLNGEIICACTAPLVGAARVLIGRGVTPSCVIELWRPGTDTWAVRGKLGAVAATVLVGEKKAPARARNRAPISFPAATATTPAEGAP